MKKRLLSILLCFLMCLSLLPTAAFAATGMTVEADDVNGIVSWGAVSGATKYEVYARDPDGSVCMNTATTTGLSYDVGSYFDNYRFETGYYTVYVTARNASNGVVQSGETVLSYVSSYARLAEPTNLRWNGTTAQWNAVPNASSYTVTLVRYAPDYSVETTKRNVTATSVNFSSDVYEDAGFYFTVTANGSNYRESTTAESPQKVIGAIAPLQPPVRPTDPNSLNLVIYNGVAQWDAISGAAKYEVYARDARGDLCMNTTYTTGRNYDVKAYFDNYRFETGYYEVTVAALDSSNRQLLQGQVMFKYVSPYIKLAAPTNLRWDGQTAKWDAVPNASSYKVTLVRYAPNYSVVITKSNVTATSFDFSSDVYENAGFYFTVIANGSTYRDSSPAESPRQDFAAPAPAEYTITVNGGKACTDNTGATVITQAKAGDTVFLIPTVPAGKVFDGWKVDSPAGLTVSELLPASFTMPEGNVTVSAKFVDPVTEYDVWVNGEQFTSDQLTISCGSGTATYDPAEKELTLNNATITKVHVGDDEAGAICSYDALTINLKGTNYIALKSSVEGTGIYTSGDLTLVGETLAMVVVNEEYNGIWTGNGDVNVAMGGILSITAGNNGIFASNDLTFSGSGRVTVTGENDCGVVAYYGDVTRTGSGDLKVVCESQDQAIYAHENVDLSGNGDVEIISDGTGICASNGSITLSCDGDVTLDCVKYGLDACSNVTIGGTGDVDVTSGGYGIYADEGLVTLSGSGAVTVTSLNDAAVIFFGADNKLLLNGSASPITLTADEGCKAVLNYSTDTSPVGGNLISHYAVTGAPDTNKVVYTWQNPEQLPMPTNLRWDGQTAAWDPVANATYYACLWYKNGTFVATNICYDCKDTTGITFEDGNKYQFYVRAYNPGNYITSEMAQGPEMTFQKEQLPMPTNLRWDGQTAAWDPVENATQYFCMWYKNGTFVVANACYDCKDTTGITFEAGNTYQFYVRAYNPGNYITSEMAQGPEKTFPVDPGPADPCEGYTDINRSSWYHPAADFVISSGLMGSTTPGKLIFEPTMPCTRSMIVQILYSYTGKPAVTFVPQFKDVKEGQWFAAPIMWAYQNNVVAGYNDGSFGPNDKVTREQMAVILMAYAKYAGKDVSKTADLSVFPDNSSASNWARPHLSWAVAEGLMSGKAQNGKNYLDPQGLASRAEVATMIRAFVQNILEG